jgi:hypothetical protein
MKGLYEILGIGAYITRAHRLSLLSVSRITWHMTTVVGSTYTLRGCAPNREHHLDLTNSMSYSSELLLMEWWDKYAA